MIPLLAAAAVLLFLASSKSAGSGMMEVPKAITQKLSDAVQAELKTLAADPGLSAQYGKISELLQSITSNPVEVYGFAVSLMQKYPSIATALSVRFNEITRKVTGKSGQEWFTWSPGPRPDGWIPVDVLYGATPVITYAQNGDNRSSRKLIGVSLDPSKFVNPADMQKVLDAAKSDFV